MTKREHCSLNCILDINNSTGMKQDLLIKHTLISEANVIANKHETSVIQSNHTYVDRTFLDFFRAPENFCFSYLLRMIFLTGKNVTNFTIMYILTNDAVQWQKFISRRKSSYFKKYFKNLCLKCFVICCVFVLMRTEFYAHYVLKSQSNEK